MEIPDPLFRRVKAKAALEGLKMKDVVAHALNGYLMEPKASVEAKTKPGPFPLVRGKGGPLLTQMNNATIARLEADEDLERYGRPFGR